MASVPIGARGKLTLLVTGEFAVDFLGNDAARVLATPFLIAYLEMASRNASKDHLDDGLDTIGTHVDVRHLAATPLGMSVTFHAEVTAVADRRITYRVWAEDEDAKSAEGVHERYIINVDRFGKRVIAKAHGVTTPRP